MSPIQPYSQSAWDKENMLWKAFEKAWPWGDGPPVQFFTEQNEWKMTSLTEWSTWTGCMPHQAPLRWRVMPQEEFDKLQAAKIGDGLPKRLTEEDFQKCRFFSPHASPHELPKVR